MKISVTRKTHRAGFEACMDLKTLLPTRVFAPGLVFRDISSNMLDMQTWGRSWPDTVQKQLVLVSPWCPLREASTNRTPPRTLGKPTLTCSMSRHLPGMPRLLITQLAVEVSSFQTLTSQMSPKIQMS